MGKRIAVAIFLILVFGLENCSGAFSGPIATDTPKAPSQTSSTSPANPTNSPTKPVQIASPTLINTTAAIALSPTLTATEGSANGITKNCLTILSVLPQPNGYQGKLILNDWTYGTVYYFYDFQTAQMTKLPNHGLLDIAVSPDGKKYAYHDESSLYLQIHSSGGILQHLIPWEKDWSHMSGWFDSDRLMFEIPEIARTEGGGVIVQYPKPLLLLNLTNGQKQKLLPDYPNIEQVYQYTEWWSGTTLYNSSLTEVVYPGKLEGTPYLGYILWDIQDNKKLAELPTEKSSMGIIGMGPVWSPDWSKFILLADGGIYIVTRDGVVDKVTNNEPPEGILFVNSDFSWSPDGRYVAFWLAVSDGTTLVVLDTQTGKMIDYCISPEYGRIVDNNNPYQVPLWSPDGKDILVEANTSADQPEGDTVLVDLEKEVAVKVTSGYWPVGWLAAP